ncbi:MAG: hypothetical protein V2A58_18390 [Planctomycetota bacterium]
MQANVPQFTGKGLRVGVLRDGCGSGPLLDDLRAVDGFDAQELRRITRLAVGRCQVVVVPQPKAALGKALVNLLESFAYNGGGLITTHDAVGYRTHPPIITDVCAKGAAHVRDSNWVVVGKQHPVTAGIPAGEVLVHSYYDHSELKCGRTGVVLAKASGTRRPVVAAGALGKGRYVACGMLPGVGPDDSNTTPTQAERILLENAVRWCGGGD